MTAVADASPVNFLVRLGCIDALSQLYTRVRVPLAVAAELSHANTPREVRNWIASPPPWLHLVHVEPAGLTIPAGFGAGEREAISLALLENASVLLMDDLQARRQAEQMRIKTAGTLGVLAQIAHLKNEDFGTLLQRLQDLGHRASPKLIASILDMHRARKLAEDK